MRPRLVLWAGEIVDSRAGLCTGARSPLSRHRGNAENEKGLTGGAAVLCHDCKERREGPIIKARAGDRDSHGRFVSGCSGNPRGRPKVDRRVRDAARAAAEEAVLLLLGLARDRGASWAQRRRACLDLCRLAYGPGARISVAAELLAGLEPPPLPAACFEPENRPGVRRSPEPAQPARASARFDFGR